MYIPTYVEDTPALKATWDKIVAAANNHPDNLNPETDAIPLPPEANITKLQLDDLVAVGAASLEDSINDRPVVKLRWSRSPRVESQDEDTSRRRGAKAAAKRHGFA